MPILRDDERRRYGRSGSKKRILLYHLSVRELCGPQSSTHNLRGSLEKAACQKRSLRNTKTQPDLAEAEVLHRSRERNVTTTGRTHVKPPMPRLPAEEAALLQGRQPYLQERGEKGRADVSLTLTGESLEPHRSPCHLPEVHAQSAGIRSQLTISGATASR